MLILYCGSLWAGGTAGMRMEALARLGNKVVGVDTTDESQGLRRLIARIARKAGWEQDLRNSNRRLLAGMTQPPALVWIDKGLEIRPETLRELRRRNPAARLVHYSLDDMSGRHNQSRRYLAGIPLYDLHVTNKSFNVSELYAMGARDVLFVNNAFDPTVHRPVQVTDEDRKRLGGAVGFIGAFEKERAEAIWHLAQHGIRVRVWGAGWGRGWEEWSASHIHPDLRVEDRPVFGDEYAKAICAFDINLCFLRRLNRDLQTTRSVEIPACGGFLLAQRTEEHQALFREYEEAVFFAGHDELLEKCRYFLAHTEERERIAAAGRRRCVESDYSYDRQLATVLAHLESAVPSLLCEDLIEHS